MTDGPIVFRTPEPKDHTTEAMRQELQRLKWRKQKRRQRAAKRLRSGPTVRDSRRRKG